MDGVIWSAEAPRRPRSRRRCASCCRKASAASRHASARVLNLVAVVDREWRGEIENRLARVGRYHPSRTIICAVEPGRTTLDACGHDRERQPGRARAEPRARHDRRGREHLAHLDAIVDPILVSGLHDRRVVAARPSRGGRLAAAARRRRAARLRRTSPTIATSLARVSELAERAYVVDLAWLRSTPWRERVAFTFDPAEWRPELEHISAVTVRHGADSAVAALLLVGWLASRLGWEPAVLAADGDGRADAAGRAASGGDVRGDAASRSTGLDVPGLAGLTLETTSGTVDLARPRARRARRDAPDARRAQLGVDGARRLARRERHPRRGRAPGAAARPHLSPRGRGGPGDAAVMERLVLDDPAAAAAERIAAAVGAGGHIALTGGSTPRAAYELARGDGRRLVALHAVVRRRALRAARRRALQLRHGARVACSIACRGARRRCTAWRASSAPTRAPMHTSRRSRGEVGEVRPACCWASAPTPTARPCSRTIRRWTSAAAAWWGWSRPAWSRWCRA